MMTRTKDGLAIGLLFLLSSGLAHSATPPPREIHLAMEIEVAGLPLAQPRMLLNSGDERIVTHGAYTIEVRPRLRNSNTAHVAMVIKENGKVLKTAAVVVLNGHAAQLDEKSETGTPELKFLVAPSW